MNKMMVANELLKIARELLAVPWTTLERGVGTSQRNTIVLDDLTSFAPKINIRVRTDAQKYLAKQDFRIDSLNDLKREWSEYLTYRDVIANHVKFHYYVVYSFVDATGVTRYSAYNCSGRIGFVERVYDLTLKYLGGPADTADRAQRAAEVHMRAKLSKGYQPTPMVRG